MTMARSLRTIALGLLYNAITVRADGPSSSSSGSSGSSSDGGGSGGGDSNTTALLIAHGFLMAFAFAVFLPTGALINQLVPWSKRTTWLHAPTQASGLLLAVAGAGIGIYLGLSQNNLDTYHPIIGLVVVFGLLAFQPLMGLYSHLRLRKTGRKSSIAPIHRWFGRIMVILGVINGGLGFMLTGIGSPGCPERAVIAYSVIAGVFVSVYLLVVVVSLARGQVSKTGKESLEKPSYRSSEESSVAP